MKVLYKNNAETSRLWRNSDKSYDEVYNEQEGLCAICHKEAKLFTDHDHETDRIRGLLCTQCNTGLGFFKDNIDYLLSAITYLNKI